MEQSLNSREEQKARRERKVFLQFATVAQFDLELASVVSERPPKPDISCVIGGVTHYFELAEIIDQGFAHKCGMHRNDDEIFGGFLSHDKPLRHVFNAKANKSYGALNGPLELLVYYNSQVAPYFDSSFIPTNVGSVANNMMTSRGWSRVWAFDTWKSEILWKRQIQ
jgi:hypothetical protein